MRSARLNFITLLLVPVLYSIFVLDLKPVKWDKDDGHESRAPVMIERQA